MRIAAIYDIHGNLPALEAVLDEICRAEADVLVVGGDVLPGPMPSESMARLLAVDIPVHFIRGNGDREVLAAMRGEPGGALPEQGRQAIQWTAQQLSSAEERLLEGWPLTIRLETEALGAVLFCHATPRNDTEIFTRLTPEDRLRAAFATAGSAAIVVCGHTHMQFDRMIGDMRIVNAGSVGMPFGDPGAYWLLLGADVELRRTDYDLAAAADRIRKTPYPQAEEFAARNVLQPPTEAEILKAFGRVELNGV